MTKQYNTFIIKTFAACSLLAIIACSTKNTKASADRKISFNNDWEFHLNDSLVDNDTIGTTTQWRTLNLPHDWSIEGTFDPKSPAGVGGGALNGGLGWYKKTFTIAVQDSTKLTSILFDGVYHNSQVWINGHYLGERPNGYISFGYNLNPYLNYGNKQNIIIVKADNAKQPNSRWYSGSGIYRNVWLQTTGKVHVIPNGTYITTPAASAQQARVSLQTIVKNDFATPKNATITTTLYKGDKKIAATSTTAAINANTQQTINQEITVDNPQLWSVEHPELYNAVTQIEADGIVSDTYTTPFGIRTFTFDAAKGFILNGRQVKIKGVCLHHDLGALGAAFNTRAMERELQIMKDMGVNGIRTTHNPPAPELLDLCDAMGFIVMDEAFDMWKQAKNLDDYSQDWEKWHVTDLQDQLYRDRNHPSIFIWSIGNEIPEQWNEQGAKIGKELAAIVKAIDTTRPVTAAMNPPIIANENVTTQFENTASKPNALAGSGALDIIGYNYAHQTYPQHPINFPGIPFIATETTSALATRGYYDAKSDTINQWPKRWDIPFNEGNPGNTVSAYDQVQTPWGSTHEATWKVIKKHDYLAGMYIWTGFDYIGEPTPYGWPSISSYFGIADLAGFPKDVYYMYQSEWTDKPVLHIFPHWNWKPGQDVDVWAYYNNADEVELYLNGTSLGKKSKQGDDLHIMWRVPYQPGTLKAVSRKNGKTVLEKQITTAGAPAALKATADRATIKADGTDLSFVTVDITDANGIFAATANNEITFSLKGNGKIVGVCSGDPVSHEPYKGNKHTALNGKCLVIIQAGTTAGTLELTAGAAGLKSSIIQIKTAN